MERLLGTEVRSQKSEVREEEVRGQKNQPLGLGHQIIKSERTPGDYHDFVRLADL
jgi:hypothetical protein